MLYLFLMSLLLIGLASGWIAYLVFGKASGLSKDRRPNWPLLFVIGVAGSFAGGLLAGLLSGEGITFHTTGLLGSAVGALLVARIYLAIAGSRDDK
ncbi:MAG: GlsB/YeaQ/YmgE family stress response membrane protein [Coriobacteriia bacterium]|nr:GlsB/YeaQ/YmgE family stress response membrane protein [Coriobacteriia bacterium]